MAAEPTFELVDLGTKVDANRSVINAPGVQTAARFDQLEQRIIGLEAKVDTGFAEMRAKFDQVDNGFAEMRGRFDQTAAGMQQIVDLLSRPDGR